MMHGTTNIKHLQTLRKNARKTDTKHTAQCHLAD